MNIAQIKKYQMILDLIVEKLPSKNCSFLVTGATGLIGSCLIDALIYSNDKYGHSHPIYALGRSLARLSARFPYKDKLLHFIVQDICDEIDDEIEVDYLIHAASNADPRSYALFPMQTILTNVVGTTSVLNYCSKHMNTRAVFSSTFEVYGKVDNKGEYVENDYGRIDINNLRSGYPVSKICSELLVKSCCVENNIDASIVRFSSVYGPTMLANDSKAHAQFIRNAARGRDIVLKSLGEQKRTYTHVCDAVTGMLYVLQSGNKGEAYNVVNSQSVISIAELANLAASHSKTCVVYDFSDKTEDVCFPRPQDCILDNSKLLQLGWQPAYDIYRGFDYTIDIVKEMELYRM